MHSKGIVFSLDEILKATVHLISDLENRLPSPRTLNVVTALSRLTSHQLELKIFKALQYSLPRCFDSYKLYLPVTECKNWSREFVEYFAAGGWTEVFKEDFADVLHLELNRYLNKIAYLAFSKSPTWTLFEVNLTKEHLFIYFYEDFRISQWNLINGHHVNESGRIKNTYKPTEPMTNEELIDLAVTQELYGTMSNKTLDDKKIKKLADKVLQTMLQECEKFELDYDQDN